MARCAWLYIHFVYLTSKWRVINAHIPQHYWDQNKPFILAFWHNRLLLEVLGWAKNQPIQMLISKHSDGKLIAKVMENFSIQTIEGSTKKGGAKAFRSLLKALKKGDCIGITPDGPRGPRFEISDGTLALAKLSGCPIIPGAYGIKRRKVLKSWDKFIFALPFTKAVFVWGDPFFIPKDAPPQDLENAKESLAKHLCDISNEADRLCGHVPLD